MLFNNCIYLSWMHNELIIKKITIIRRLNIYKIISNKLIINLESMPKQLFIIYQVNIT